MRKVWLGEFFACPRSQLLHDSVWVWTQAFPELTLFRDWAKRIEKKSTRWISDCHFLEKKKSIQIQSDDVPIYCHSELTSIHGPVIMSNSQPWRVSPKIKFATPSLPLPFPHRSWLAHPFHSHLLPFSLPSLEFPFYFQLLLSGLTSISSHSVTCSQTPLYFVLKQDHLSTVHWPLEYLAFI